MKANFKLISASLILAVGLCVWGVQEVKFLRSAKLTILHVNDTHSHFEPVNGGQYNGMGGLMERAAYIDSVRKADGPQNVLLLHAGDFCQGSIYFTQFGGDAETGAINILGYDAVTLGNHEFDNGIEALGELLSKLEVPVVVCNYDFSAFEAGKYIKPYVIVEKAGKKIGVIGVLCKLRGMVSTDIADRIPEFDMAQSLQKYADELRPQCDLVIALTHIGYTEHNPGDITDPMLAAATRNVDIFIGAHSHTFLDESVYVYNLDNKKVPIVQTGWMGTRMGEFKVRL